MSGLEEPGAVAAAAAAVLAGLVPCCRCLMPSWEPWTARMHTHQTCNTVPGILLLPGHYTAGMSAP